MLPWNSLNKKSSLTLEDVILDVKGARNTIPYVNESTLAKGIKSSISCYLIFVKDFHKDSSDLPSETKENLDLFKFLQEFQDIFTDDIPGELPPTRGKDDNSIDIVPDSSPPNQTPYRVSQAQQEEASKWVNG